MRFLRKLKQRTRKFFGYPEDNWARLGGPHGKKRSYGHFAGGGNPGGRTVAEIRNADERHIERADTGEEK
jgi:hypothetical protein